MQPSSEIFASKFCHDAKFEIAEGFEGSKSDSRGPDWRFRGAKRNELQNETLEFRGGVCRKRAFLG